MGTVPIYQHRADGMHEVTLPSGEVYCLDSREAVILLLRSENYREQAIADVVGESKAGVSLTLRRHGLKGHLQYEDALDPELFKKLTDEAIAAQYRVPVYRIHRMRKMLQLDGLHERRNFKRRRELLARFMFRARPGPKFNLYIKSLLYDRRVVTPHQAQLIEDFYLSGRGDNTIYARVRRNFVRKRLRDYVDQHEDRVMLVAQGVIEEGTYGQSGSESDGDEGRHELRTTVADSPARG